MHLRATPYVDEYKPYTAHNGCLPPFWVKKYDEQAKIFWEEFYKRNQDRFFKDRNYLRNDYATEISGPNATAENLGQDRTSPPHFQEFVDSTPESNQVQDFLQSMQNETHNVVLLEAGCGVGNTIFPLVKVNQNLRVFAFDFSETAVDIVRKHPLAARGRVTAAVGDLTSGQLPCELACCHADFATLIFVLSAITPSKMPLALQTVGKGLRMGGLVLFRDYAAGDGAQRRFQASGGTKRLDSELPFFVRGDGTQAYYFSEEELCSLFQECGFDRVSLVREERLTANRKTGECVGRLYWVGKFRKTS